MTVEFQFAVTISGTCPGCGVENWLGDLTSHRCNEETESVDEYLERIGKEQGFYDA